MCGAGRGTRTGRPRPVFEPQHMWNELAWGSWGSAAGPWARPLYLSTQHAFHSGNHSTNDGVGNDAVVNPVPRQADHQPEIVHVPDH